MSGKVRAVSSKRVDGGQQRRLAVQVLLCDVLLKTTAEQTPMKPKNGADVGLQGGARGVAKKEERG